MKLKPLNLKIIFWILLFITLFVRGVIFLDPDFGWRLKSGEIILHFGIPYSDPFTYTMPSYPWINHAWGTDVLIYLIYNKVGVFGLSFLSTCITLLTIHLIHLSAKNIKPRLKTKNIDRRYLDFPLLAITAACFLRFFGVRAQIWTWFFISIVFNIVLDENKWKKWRSFLPLLFLLWTNLHGGFAAGLVTLVFVVITRTIRERRVILTDYLLIVLSILATFVNPYGVGIYKEVWDTITDNENHKNILEWNNYFKSFNLPSLLLIVFSSVFAYTRWRKLKIEELGLFILFFYQALTAVRQIPIWGMMAFFVSSKLLGDFLNNLKDKIATNRFKEVYKVFYVIVLFVFLIEVLLTYVGSIYYSEETFYPKGAVYFLKRNDKEGEIFSKYDYGGYLVWKLPEKKVFIDGRMPFWKRESLPNESSSAMSEYMSLFRGEINYKPIFEKYNIKTVLWDNTSINEDVENNAEFVLDNFQFLKRLLGIKKHAFNLIRDLERDGWSKVYEDDISVIYQKN